MVTFYNIDFLFLFSHDFFIGLLEDILPSEIPLFVCFDGQRQLFLFDVPL